MVSADKAERVYSLRVHDTIVGFCRDNRRVLSKRRIFVEIRGRLGGGRG
jgi:hypothetical protein